ncbi:MAG: protein translocase subunit SecF [Candidatus Kapaibacterium sp.]|jgi:preprotein translocase subunit SecF
MQFFGKTQFDFLSKRKFFLILSVIIMVTGLALTAILGLDYGIDFEGGTELAVQFESPVETDRIREGVASLGITGTEIKSFGGENQYIIRIKQSEHATKEIGEAINKAIPEVEMIVLKMDQIGPKIGAELRTRALLSIFVALAALLLYIAFRFEFAYGLGSVVAILHDIIATFSVALVLHKTGVVNMEIDQTFLAAMLTVIGYSINSTVIIFDRIRENYGGKMKGQDFITIANTSINETLSRTVITVSTTLMVLIILLIFGGPVLRPFAVVMSLGVVFGVYSSIYISSAFVSWFMERRQAKAK